MRAIVQDGYGALSDVVRLAELENPAVEAGGVLVRVRASSIHVGDVYSMKGVPYLFRPLYGLRRPKERVPGTDIAGTIEAVGSDVTEFGPGDEVFGWCKGAFAEFATTASDQVVTKPAELTFEQAAAVGVSARTALQGLRDHGRVQAGQTVLIVGASGGVGTFAVQIAKSLGAEVTAVCRTRNMGLVRSIGADLVIDYTSDDFTQGDQRYDFIFDNVGKHSLSETRRALTPGGRLLSNGAPVGGWTRPLGHFAKAAVSSMFVRQQVRPFDLAPNVQDLATLKDLIQSGKLTPVIDESYPLEEAATAVSHVADGHTRGTTIITM